MSYRSDVLAAVTATEQAHRQLQRAARHATDEQRPRVQALVRKVARLVADLEHESHVLQADANRS